MLDQARTVIYQDLKNIETIESYEGFVGVKVSGIQTQIINNFQDTSVYNGIDLYVRKTVLEKLQQVSETIHQKTQGYLVVTFGYRSMQVQTERFQQRLSEIAKEKYYDNPIDLYEEVHKNIAVPSVAGHPTGGAVDVSLMNEYGKIVDMGAPMYDYSKPGYETFAEGITEEAMKNRMMLREAMMQVGFAPFDGEYWHFSYGDKEWAFYYNQANALYDQVSVDEVYKMVVEH